MVNWDFLRGGVLCVRLMVEGFTGSVAGQSHGKGLHVHFGESHVDYWN